MGNVVLHVFQKRALSLSFTQESGEFTEGFHAGALPLRVSALPTCRPAEGPDSDRAFRPFRSICSPVPPPALLFHFLLVCPHNHPQPASRHGAVSDSNIPTQPQHSRASLPSPNSGAYLPQPQPEATATVAVATTL